MDDGEDERWRGRAMARTSDGEDERWRALQNRVIRESGMEENTRSWNEWARRGPRLPHKHAKREGKGGPILPSPQRGQMWGIL